MFLAKVTFKKKKHSVSVFKKCDFSKEHCSSLKMILGSKHVGAILNFKKCNFSKEQYVH